MQFFRWATLCNQRRGLSQTDIQELLVIIDKLKDNPLREYHDLSQYLAWRERVVAAEAQTEGYRVSVISVDKADVPALGDLPPIRGTF
jgi:hypothetical protein